MARSIIKKEMATPIIKSRLVERDMGIKESRIEYFLEYHTINDVRLPFFRKVTYICYDGQAFKQEFQLVQNIDVIKNDNFMVKHSWRDNPDFPKIALKTVKQLLKASVEIDRANAYWSEQSEEDFGRILKTIKNK